MDIIDTHDWTLKCMHICIDKKEIIIFLFDDYELKEVEFAITEFINYSCTNEAPWGKSNLINEVEITDGEKKEIIIQLQSGDNIKIDYFGEVVFRSAKEL